MGGCRASSYPGSPFILMCNASVEKLYYSAVIVRSCSIAPCYQLFQAGDRLTSTGEYNLLLSLFSAISACVGTVAEANTIHYTPFQAGDRQTMVFF